MILSIRNYYNLPDSSPYLCVPLKKYHQFFLDKNQELEGFSKIALQVAWIATGVFAYPIFGLMAGLGVGFKAASNNFRSMDPIHMTDEQLTEWGRTQGVKAWNDVQEAKMKHFIDHPPKDPMHLGNHDREGMQRQYHFQLWCRPRGDAHSLEQGESTPDQLQEEMAYKLRVATDVLHQKAIVNCIYERGGHADPLQRTGIIFAYFKRMI